MPAQEQQHEGHLHRAGGGRERGSERGEVQQDQLVEGAGAGVGIPETGEQARVEQQHQLLAGVPVQEIEIVPPLRFPLLQTMIYSIFIYYPCLLE